MLNWLQCSAVLLLKPMSRPWAEPQVESVLHDHGHHGSSFFCGGGGGGWEVGGANGGPGAQAPHWEGCGGGGGGGHGTSFGAGHGWVAHGSQTTDCGGGAAPESVFDRSHGCPSPKAEPFAASYHTLILGEAMRHWFSNW